MKETSAVKFMYWKKETNKVSGEYEASRYGSLISFPFLHRDFSFEATFLFLPFRTAAF
jgi:hypothetical protein